MLPDDLASDKELEAGVKRARKTLSSADKQADQPGTDAQVKTRKRFQKIMEDNLANAEHKLTRRRRR